LLSQSSAVVQPVYPARCDGVRKDPHRQHRSGD
jgi:hypothetical protein